MKNIRLVIITAVLGALAVAAYAAATSGSAAAKTDDESCTSGCESCCK